MNNRKQRVLIVDDDSTSISILANILQELYDISIALNAKQALRVITKISNLDLVLLDVEMPDMNGYAMCKLLKENPKTLDIPVIFVTANSNEDDEQHGLELGAVDYITKPFRPAIVKARIKNHLELKYQRDFLKHLSYHDGLTQVANRSHFDDYLKDEWKRATRNQSPLSLIMIDIDNFKLFNDFYGHVHGDECLKRVAEAIKNSLERPTDLAARYGGEEFSCILPSTSLAGAAQLAEQIRINIYQLAIPHPKSLTDSIVTISLGVSQIIPTQGDKITEFIQQADRKLYRAKKEGRNRIIFKEINELAH